MYKGLSSVPGVKKGISLLDRRYARQRALQLIEDRLSYLETVASRYETLEPLRHVVEQALRPCPSGHSLERFGLSRDGGYILAVDVLRREPILSFGVGSDSSADDELARQGHAVFQFDHTIEKSPTKEPRVKFFKIGIRGNAGPKDTVCLAEALALAGIATNDEFSMLMDVEGAEWSVLSSAGTDLRNCRQISLELHSLDRLADPAIETAFRIALEKLSDEFVSVYAHGNNFAPAVNFGGMYMPTVVEVTFVRKDLFVDGCNTGEEFLASTQNDPMWPDLHQTLLFKRGVRLSNRHSSSLGSAHLSDGCANDDC